MDKYLTALPKLVVMLIISLGLFLVSNLGVFNDLQGAGMNLNLAISKPFIGVIQKVDDGWHLVTNLQQIQVENLQLKDQIAQLNQQLADMQSTQSQNQLLLSQQNLQLPHNSPQLICPVARYEYIPAPGYIYVSVGIKSGVKPGDLAVRYNYVVGQVIALYGDYAKVRLLTANDTNMPVHVGDKGAVGKFVGDAGLSFKVTDVDQAAEVSVGDNVKLLDATGEDLPGYIVGRVSQITGLDSDATKTLQVDSGLDFSKLDYVIIVANHV